MFIFLHCSLFERDVLEVREYVANRSADEIWFVYSDGAASFGDGTLI